MLNATMDHGRVGVDVMMFLMPVQPEMFLGVCEN